MTTAHPDTEQKTALREKAKLLRASIPAITKTTYDTRITELILNLSVINVSRTVACFVSLPEEISTEGIRTALLESGKILALPRVDHGNLVFFMVSGKQDLEPGVFDLLEPKKVLPVIPTASIDCFLVPGLAFDRCGNRLGWGKGYYDRALSARNVPKIGLAYDCQIVSFVPHTPSDIPMDMIVTEQGIIEPKGQVL